jgi:hypothetical protein
MRRRRFRARRFLARLGLVPVALAAVGLAVPAASALAAPAAPVAVAAPVVVAAPAVDQVVTVTGHTAHSAHGTIVVHTQSKRAGSCSMFADWTAHYGSQQTNDKSNVWVKAYIDECSGGGTLKYQSEMICTTDSGGQNFNYGPWENTTTQGSNIARGNGCWEGVGTANGVPTTAALRENMLNPTRINCRSPLSWINGRTVKGSNCGTTT